MPQRMMRRCVGLFAGLGAACALVLFFFAPATLAQGGEPRSFAIKGARIVPVTGPVIEHGTVVVVNGLIKAVGADVPIPPEAWVVDGKGLTVYPGLIDAMTDLGIVSAEAGPPQGGAGAGRGARRQIVPSEIAMGPEDRPGTTPWEISANEIKPEDKRIETWRSAGFTTTLSSPKGGIFTGQGSVIDLAGERAGDMVVKSPATLDIAFTPVGGFWSFPGSLMGVVAYVRQVFEDTRWYEQAEPVYAAHTKGLERPTYDRTERTVAHALAIKELVLIPGNSDIQIRRALRLIQEWNLRAAIYGAQQGYLTAEEIAAKRIPVLVNLKWPDAERDADPDADVSLDQLRFRDRAPSSPGALAKAGVKFAFYSGGMNNPKDILKNTKKAIDAGLARDAALRAFTMDAAEILGVDDRLGSIEPGKIANLVVADGDIFNEKTKIKNVFVDGQRFDIHEAERPKDPPKGNMTGKWTLSYTTPEGPESSTLDVAMAPDGTLSGTFTSRRGASAISSAWLSGNAFHFTITITMGPAPADVNFSGTFDGNSLKGSISVGGFSTEFTGTRPGGGMTTATEN
jgi:Amidohydrolase family